MPNPDLAPLVRALQAAERDAQARPDEHADGAAYYDERRAIEEAARRVQTLRVRLAEMEASGRSLRQKIGIARRQLGTPDDSHAHRVARITDGRTQSTTDCTLSELRAILAEYQAAGFQVKPPKRVASAAAPSAEQIAGNGLLAKVQALLADQRLPWSYAEAILRRQRGISDRRVRCPLRTLSAQEARALIAALANRQARQTREGAA